ncbi:hypothetical protein DIPPA_34025 [Diplonema papillatum]|nr:hypothetical protein DIPPA_34025 [Diplonema papillatum]KAJ9460943.1 hypothetical protein DIPPA_34025 [Diplonema papillatum]KAJ9460944.1 hypothetical protein DIPPA_34025 [Diplonema papillatum]KAJ9460945.1 hypothetical protein DIPPA_34025 [Diplonema papillatum]
MGATQGKLPADGLSGMTVFAMKDTPNGVLLLAEDPRGPATGTTAISIESNRSSRSWRRRAYPRVKDGDIPLCSDRRSSGSSSEPGSPRDDYASTADESSAADHPAKSKGAKCGRKPVGRIQSFCKYPTRVNACGFSASLCSPLYRKQLDDSRRESVDPHSSPTLASSEQSLPASDNDGSKRGSSSLDDSFETPLGVSPKQCRGGSPPGAEGAAAGLILSQSTLAANADRITHRHQQQQQHHPGRRNQQQRVAAKVGAGSPEEGGVRIFRDPSLLASNTTSNNNNNNNNNNNGNSNSNGNNNYNGTNTNNGNNNNNGNHSNSGANANTVNNPGGSAAAVEHLSFSYGVNTWADTDIRAALAPLVPFRVHYVAGPRADASGEYLLSVEPIFLAVAEFMEATEPAHCDSQETASVRLLKDLRRAGYTGGAEEFPGLCVRVLHGLIRVFPFALHPHADAGFAAVAAAALPALRVEKRFALSSSGIVSLDIPCALPPDPAAAPPSPQKKARFAGARFAVQISQTAAPQPSTGSPGAASSRFDRTIWREYAGFAALRCAVLKAGAPVPAGFPGELPLTPADCTDPLEPTRRSLEAWLRQLIAYTQQPPGAPTANPSAAAGFPGGVGGGGGAHPPRRSTVVSSLCSPSDEARVLVCSLLDAFLGGARLDWGGAGAPKQLLRLAMTGGEEKVGISYKNCRILRVSAGRPGARAGLTEGMSIVAVDGRLVASDSEIQDCLKAAAEALKSPGNASCGVPVIVSVPTVDGAARRLRRPAEAAPAFSAISLLAAEDEPADVPLRGSAVLIKNARDPALNGLLHVVVEEAEPLGHWVVVPVSDARKRFVVSVADMILTHRCGHNGTTREATMFLHRPSPSATFGLDVNDACVITRVRPGSIAALAGLSVGQFIACAGFGSTSTYSEVERVLSTSCQVTVVTRFPCSLHRLAASG